MRGSTVIFLSSLFGFFLNAAFAAEPSPHLTIENGSEQLSFSTEQLLARPDIETLTLSIEAYGQREMHLKALPLANLFRNGLPDNAIIIFSCSDGFSAPLDRARLLNRDPKASIAFLAIEPKSHKWPNLPGKTASAGPFFLVWKHPELSKIGREEWPYQLSGFKVSNSFASIFPKTLPPRNDEAIPSVAAGFEEFKRNCFVCHTMNGQGTGHIGPDLNLPMNPTQYLTPEGLRKLIRNPASVRRWPDSKMPGFPDKVLPETNLEALIAYLQAMRQN